MSEFEDLDESVTDESIAADDDPPELRAAGMRGAEAIVGSLQALPAPVRGELLWSLLTDDDLVLSAIADAMRSDDPVLQLGESLIFETWCGNALEVAERLSDDVEPWSVIRRAVFDVRDALLEEGWRVWFEFRRMGRDAYFEAHPGDRGLRPYRPDGDARHE